MSDSIRFPGLAGSRVSRPALNLVSGDTANMVQGIGAWRNVVGADTFSVVNDPDSPFGASAMQWLSDLNNNRIIVTGVDGAVPVVPGNQYRIGISLKTMDVDTDYRFEVLQDGGSTSFPTQTFRVADGWISDSVSISINAGVSELSIQIRVGVTDNDNIVIGDRFRFAAYWISDSLVNAFSPSFDVAAGSFEVRDPSDIQVDYTPGDTQLFIGDSWAGDGAEYSLHDGVDASAPKVVEWLASDAASKVVGND